MRVPSVLCWVRAVLHSIGLGTFVSGHSYREVEVRDGCRIQVLKCDECGKTSVGWEVPAVKREGWRHDR